MALTRKHFNEIAKILKRNKYHINMIGCFKGALLGDLVEYFKSENPNFDEERFKEAVL